MAIFPSLSAKSFLSCETSEKVANRTTIFSLVDYGFLALIE